MRLGNGCLWWRVAGGERWLGKKLGTEILHYNHVVEISRSVSSFLMFRKPLKLLYFGEKGDENVRKHRHRAKYVVKLLAKPAVF